MTRIYALANQKGGVGKTTTAVNLGAYLSSCGLRVLIADVDPQSNATSSLGVDKRSVERSTYQALVAQCSLEEIVTSTEWDKLYLAPASPDLAGAEIELVAANGREYLLRQAVLSLDRRYDYVLIDCPPSLGLLTVNALTAALHGVIVPIQCEYLALEGLTELLNTIHLVRERLNPRLTVRGILMTMYDPRTNLSQQVVDEVKRHFDRYVFKTVIPRNVRLGEAPSFGKPIMAYAPKSAGARAYQSLTIEILRTDGWRIPPTTADAPTRVSPPTREGQHQGGTP
jgi:chromosome partitioning protein